VATPLEAGINSYYFYSRRRYVRRLTQLTVIGITGSYGKTSTKYILNALLSPYYPTLMTPESFNTPMGICKVIHRQLTPEHRYFIVEMGARRRRDIRTLARLVRPKIGVITAIGPQHLESFGSLENVMRTKAELLEALPGDGLAVLNFDNPHCRKLAEGLKVAFRSFGMDCPEEVDLRAEGMSFTGRGIRFKVRTRQGEEAEFRTCLLGRHNVYNVLAAASVALACGLSLEQIAAALEKVQPVPHRLQLSQGIGGVLILDDAFNANPAGARQALEVLGSLPGRKKILVTPGLIELGELQEKANFEFGQQAAGVCDLVILVGPKQTQAVASGLAAAGFPPEKVMVARSLAEATAQLRRYVAPGDVVLFENDLPDNYSE